MGPIVVEPTGQFNGIKRFVGLVRNREAGGAVIVASLVRLKLIDANLLAEFYLAARRRSLADRDSGHAQRKLQRRIAS
jgi:hypothetical protein